MMIMFFVSAATTAAAGVDPQPDSMGIYFDLAGNDVTSYENLFVPFDAYLLLANPTAAVDGFECTVRTEGAMRLILETYLGAGADDADPSADGYAVSAAGAYPDGPVLQLVHWRFMILNADRLLFYVTEATAPSLPASLPAVTGDGAWRPCLVSSGNVNWAVACVNCWDSTEAATFGAIKSLYR